MLKVEHKDLEEITKCLDKIALTRLVGNYKKLQKNQQNAANLSKMIKDKYTEIKPDYERKN